MIKKTQAIPMIREIIFYFLFLNMIQVPLYLIHLKRAEHDSITYLESYKKGF